MMLYVHAATAVAQRVIFPSQTTIAAPTQPFFAQPSFLGAPATPKPRPITRHTVQLLGTRSTIPPLRNPTLQPSIPAVRPWDRTPIPACSTSRSILRHKFRRPRAPVSPYAYGSPPYGAQPYGAPAQGPLVKCRSISKVLIARPCDNCRPCVRSTRGSPATTVSTSSTSTRPSVGVVRRADRTNPRAVVDHTALQLPLVGRSPVGCDCPRRVTCPAGSNDAFLERRGDRSFNINFGADLAVAVGVFMRLQVHRQKHAARYGPRLGANQPDAECQMASVFGTSIAIGSSCCPPVAYHPPEES